MINKNTKTILLGDTHLNKHEHRIKAFHKYIDYLLENYADYNVIQMGDLFDTASTPYPIVQKVAEKLNKFKSCVILTGNHDYNSFMKNSLLQLEAYSNIHIIDKVFSIDNLIFLPYPNTKAERIEMENLTGNYKYGFGHITTKHNRFYDGEEINFNPDLKIETLFTGHIHDSMEFEEKHDNEWQSNVVVVGVPYPTRNGEQGFKHRIIELDLESEKYKSLSLPEMHTIEDVIYGNEPKDKDNVLNILDAPSTPAAQDFYKEYYVRSIDLKKDANSKDNERLNEASNLSDSILEKYKAFAKEKEVETKVREKAIEALAQVG